MAATGLQETLQLKAKPTVLKLTIVTQTCSIVQSIERVLPIGLDGGYVIAVETQENYNNDLVRDVQLINVVVATNK